MKMMKKIFALLIAMVMVLGMSTTVFAAELPTGTAGADKTITITPPTGVADDATNTYTVYKVFSATTGANNTISYQSLDGNAPTGFVVDDANNVYLGTTTDAATGATGEISIMVGGSKKYIVPSTASELTADQIAAIAAYTGKVEVGTVSITGSTAKTVTVPDYGYYYVTTTTGSVVSINSTNKSASIQDKNTLPPVEKKIIDTAEELTAEQLLTQMVMAGTIDDNGKKALAELGREVTYTGEITVGKGAKNYVFHDKMGTGLTFKGNNFVTVTANPAVTTADWYTIKPTPDTGDTLTVTFIDGLPENTKITITYIGIVNSDNLTVDTGKNTAQLTYGDTNSNNHTPVTETNVYNAKFTVTKKDNNNQPLAEAGFIIKNANNAYYKVTETTTGEGASAVTTKSVSWYKLQTGETLEAAIAAGMITENFSDSTGAVPSFTGLVDGTYTLIESTVPAGFNKAADSTFTIAAKDYSDTNLVQAADVINNAGSVLPSTGGMGTTIFYVLGAVLMLGAGVVLVTRRRMDVQ